MENLTHQEIAAAAFLHIPERGPAKQETTKKPRFLRGWKPRSMEGYEVAELLKDKEKYHSCFRIKERESQVSRTGKALNVQFFNDQEAFLFAKEGAVKFNIRVKVRDQPGGKVVSVPV